MSQPPVVVRLLAEQRKRCLATVLNAAENSRWWATLGRDEQQLFTQQVKVAINVFYDLTRDVVKVTDEDTVRNDVALDMIRALHAGQRDIATQLKGLT